MENHNFNGQMVIFHRYMLNNQRVSHHNFSPFSCQNSGKSQQSQDDEAARKRYLENLPPGTDSEIGMG